MAKSGGKDNDFLNINIVISYLAGVANPNLHSLVCVIVQELNLAVNDNIFTRVAVGQEGRRRPKAICSRYILLDFAKQLTNFSSVKILSTKSQDTSRGNPVPSSAQLVPWSSPQPIFL